MRSPQDDRGTRRGQAGEIGDPTRYHPGGRERDLPSFPQ
jgi:hypothetical protein